MGLEAATQIQQLDSNNPVGGTDQVSQGDDHLRMIKLCLRNSFPNFVGALTASNTSIDALIAAFAALGVPTSGRVDNPATVGTLNFTPNATALNNEMHYIRVGNICMCTGQMRGSITGFGFFTAEITLPIASLLANSVDDLNGVVTGPDLIDCRVAGNPVTDRAELSCNKPAGSLIVNAYYHFSYRVL